MWVVVVGRMGNTRAIWVINIWLIQIPHCQSFSGPFTVFRKQLLFDVSLVDDQDAVLLLTSSHILRLSSGYSLLYGMVLFWFSV